MDALNKKIADLEGRLKQEVENNIALEQYTQRENLRFHNFEAKEHEDCKVVMCKVLEKELGVDTAKFDFMQSTRLAIRLRGTWSTRCQSKRSIFVHKQWKILAPKAAFPSILSNLRPNIIYLPA